MKTKRLLLAAALGLGLFYADFLVMTDGVLG